MSLLTDLWPSIIDDSGTKTDGTVLGQTLFDTIKAAIEDLIHSTINPTISPADLIDEVVLARGNLDSLDARISVLIDDDGHFVVGGVVQRLNTNVNQFANNGAFETDLATYSVPANTLGTNGQVVHVTAWGSFAANGNNKAVKVYFGATSITLHSTTTSGGEWRLEADIIRTGSASQILRGVFQAGASMIALATPVTPAEDLAGAVIVKLTGTASSTNDILQNGFIVEAKY